MADSSNARGSARATGRKAARKTGAAATPAKAAGKTQKAAPAKTRPSTQPERKVVATPRVVSTPRVAATLPTAERQRMIAEAAYYLSQRRGAAPGNPHHDWLQAEAEIDALLLRRLTDD